MTDIVERLREDARVWRVKSLTGELEREAADEIERLRKENTLLRALAGDYGDNPPPKDRYHTIR